MLFKYKALNTKGESSEGTIEATNVDVAISALQHRDLVIQHIDLAENSGGFFDRKIHIFERITNKEIVIFSRQMSTLFTAQVSALRIFRLLAGESQNELMRRIFSEISDDIQGGSTISSAFSKFPKVFSPFYVNMVKAGEEAGKLDQVFTYLADYLDRNYAITSKAKNALIYPAFVVFTFVVVMSLMLTVVIPKITTIIEESGQPIPVYTQIVIKMSDFLQDYGLFFLVSLIIVGFFVYRAAKGEGGSMMVDQAKLAVPFVGNLYKKLYLSRIADNMNTMLSAGIPMIKSLELTSNVVGSEVYGSTLNQSLELVKGGVSLSEAFSRFPDEIPSIMVQMTKIGEETGEVGHILDTLAKFYQREVVNAVDTLVDLIEPVMIVALGLGVAFLLASVLIPIYNISGSI